MTSKQDDVMEQYFAWVDAFVHAFGQDYPMRTAEVETDAVLLRTWYESNPAQEGKLSKS